jgi:hypothetical protein
LYLDCGTLRVVLALVVVLVLENPDVSQHKGRVDGPRPEGLAVFQGASECKEVEDENDDEDENDWGSGGRELRPTIERHRPKSRRSKQ